MALEPASKALIRYQTEQIRPPAWLSKAYEGMLERATQLGYLDPSTQHHDLRAKITEIQDSVAVNQEDKEAVSMVSKQRENRAIILAQSKQEPMEIELLGEDFGEKDYVHPDGKKWDPWDFAEHLGLVELQSDEARELAKEFDHVTAHITVPGTSEDGDKVGL